MRREDAGVGKTRLVQEFADRATRDGATVLSGGNRRATGGKRRKAEGADEEVVGEEAAGRDG